MLSKPPLRLRRSFNFAPTALLPLQEPFMNPIRVFVAVSLAVLATACASPGPMGGTTLPANDAHAEHHPDGMPTMSAMEPRMKAMQAMHQKMANAKTPAEREALMAEHMKAMQGGMDMMKEMHGMGAKGMPPAGSAERDRMMADHMATMQMMKTMLADCMPPAAPAR
jgi:hypothetical protein